MNILVTGSEGYIGTVMVKYLADAGHVVTGLDTGFFRVGSFYPLDNKAIRTIHKDIRNVTVEDVTGFDTVIHLAELSNDPLGQIDPDLTRAVNHEGTKNLVRQCIAAGVIRFVYSSSCSVYGASDAVSDETSPVNPQTAYAGSKVANEAYLLSSGAPMTVVILRNSTVYGPSPRMRFDLAVNNLAGLAWTTGKVKMESDGTPWRPFVHIVDVCEAFRLAATAPARTVDRQIMNVGDTRSNYQIHEIADIIARVFGVRDITLNPNAPDKRNYRVNFDKIARLLPGFLPKHTVETGAQELKSLFETVCLDEQTFRSDAYTRLKMIRLLMDTGKLDKKLIWL